VKVRIPLVGQPNQRNLDSLQALIECKDQRYTNGILIPIHNPLTGKTTVYFEKRPGFEIADIGDCEGLISPGCDATALHFSRAVNKYVVALCDDIFVNCTAIGDTNPDAEPTIDSTFWNPRDIYGGTLSDSNYKVTINSHGSADSIQPTGGLENTAVLVGKTYWEIIIDECVTDGNNPTLSFGFLDRFDAPGFYGGATTSPNYDDRNIRSSDEVVLTALKTDGFFWHSNAGSVAAKPLLQALGGNPTATVTVSTTGVSGFEAGDVIMFAFDRDAGKLWLGKNGTWFNSGDPAAGTNPQVTNLLEPAYSGGNDPHWRLVFATSHYPYATNPVEFSGAFGNSTFPQAYTAPTGFTSNLARSSVDFDDPSWAFRASSAELMSPATHLNAWAFGSTLDLNDQLVAGYSAAVLQAGELYYWEMTSDIGSTTNHLLGIRVLGESLSNTQSDGTAALWRGDGTLSTGSGASPITKTITGVTTYSLTDRLMFAVNLSTGKMWVGKNGTWTNSGDPAAGTNPQFENIPTNERFRIHQFILANSRRSEIKYPAAFSYTAPTGFREGVPLTVASA
jgi:hypothetical protein